MRKIKIGKQELEKLYLDEGLNTTQIGKRYGLGREAIRQRLIHYEIPRRDNSRRHQGFRHTKETRKTISELVKGNNHPLWGKHHSEASRVKMSESHKGRFTGEESPNWKGGEFVDYHGYVRVKKPEHPQADYNGYVRQTWLIAECILGRLLKNNEMVHHINENRADNRNENLLICTRGYHVALHHKMRARRRCEKAVAS